jgi:hypothetical protein
MARRPLFAALSVLYGRVIGRCMQRPRHNEFIRFLNAIEREVPPEKSIRAVLGRARPLDRILQFSASAPGVGQPDTDGGRRDGVTGAFGETAVDVTCDAALGQRCRVAHIPTAPTTTTAGSDAMISDRRSGLDKLAQVVLMASPAHILGAAVYLGAAAAAPKHRSREQVAKRNLAGEGVGLMRLFSTALVAILSGFLASNPASVTDHLRSLDE